MPGPAFLAGEDVSLHTVEEEDGAFLHESINSPEIRIPMQPSRPYSLADLSALLGPDPDSSAVRLLLVAGTAPLGLVGYSEVDETAGTAEISCWIRPEYWGEGYGTESVELLVEYGFVEEGRRREQDFVDGEFHDCLLYGLLAEEWRDASAE